MLNIVKNNSLPHTFYWITHFATLYVPLKMTHPELNYIKMKLITRLFRIERIPLN